jgi:hypothetical protein
LLLEQIAGSVLRVTAGCGDILCRYGVSTASPERAICAPFARQSAAGDEFCTWSPSMKLHTTRRDKENVMGKQLDDQTLVDFTRRWFALWTEADPQARSRQVADLWATNGAQVLVDPPQEVRDAATALAFPVPRLEVRGHDEIDRRVTQAFAMFVEPGVYTFQAAAGDAVLLAPALVGLAWDMVTVADGTVAGSGYDVLVLDDDGRILLDHQHIAPR